MRFHVLNPTKIAAALGISERTLRRRFATAYPGRSLRSFRLPAAEVPALARVLGLTVEVNP